MATLESTKALVEMIVPADVDKQALVISGSAFFNATTRELQTSGDVTIRFSNGVQLNIRQAQVKIVPTGGGGNRRVLITPLPAPNK